MYLALAVEFVSEEEYYFFLADFGLLTFARVAIVVIVRAFCANQLAVL